jgi:hypothetical protein
MVIGIPLHAPWNCPTVAENCIFPASYRDAFSIASKFLPCLTQTTYSAIRMLQSTRNSSRHTTSRILSGKFVHVCFFCVCVCVFIGLRERERERERLVCLFLFVCVCVCVCIKRFCGCQVSLCVYIHTYIHAYIVLLGIFIMTGSRSAKRLAEEDGRQPCTHIYTRTCMHMYICHGLQI